MNQEIKAQWVEALRSGEYEQGGGKLKKEGKFCCLGVLTALHAKVEPSVVEKLDTEYFLPCLTAQWAGFDSTRGEDLSIDGDTAKMSEHNDGCVDFGFKTFAQIADAIEEQL